MSVMCLICPRCACCAPHCACCSRRDDVEDLCTAAVKEEQIEVGGRCRLYMFLMFWTGVCRSWLPVRPRLPPATPASPHHAALAFPELRHALCSFFGHVQVKLASVAQQWAQEVFTFAEHKQRGPVVLKVCAGLLFCVPRIQA